MRRLTGDKAALADRSQTVAAVATYLRCRTRASDARSALLRSIPRRVTPWRGVELRGHVQWSAPIALETICPCPSLVRRSGGDVQAALAARGGPALGQLLPGSRAQPWARHESRHVVVLFAPGSADRPE